MKKVMLRILEIVCFIAVLPFLLLLIILIITNSSLLGYWLIYLLLFVPACVAVTFGVLLHKKCTLISNQSAVLPQASEKGKEETDLSLIHISARTGRW